MSTPSDQVVRIEQVNKTYMLGKNVPPVHALRHVTLNIPRGQYVAVMGPSGSGKSTLMNILGCLDRPSNGRYILDGHDVSNLADEPLSKVRGQLIGFIFQAFNLIPQLTVQENVEVPMFYQGIHPAERHQRAARVLEKVGLADRMDHRPNQLSGGQQQRVAVARALVNDPSILMADEPTGNLDSKTGDAILTVIDELHREGLTIIMVTHDDAVADRCQRVVRLLDGEVSSDTVNGHAVASI
ncbi:MAG: ABC transporter ATP-binding protein [Phycisphaeraceae bacterium]|nr:ABC transporter ATP-binding protein [Phycisphaeraceae bacterium]